MLESSIGQLRQGVRMGGVFALECYDPNKQLKWHDTAVKLVTNEGLQHALDVLFTAATQTAAWHVGLMDDTPDVTAGATLATADGFTEFSEYTGGRQEFVDVRAVNTVTNSASTVSFAITGVGGGVGGALLAAASAGTSTILLCGAALTGGNRAVATGDTVVVTYSFTAADDGA